MACLDAPKTLFLILAATVSAIGQNTNTSTLIGAGYLYPAPITIAPGQVITLFVSGLGSDLTQPVFAGFGSLPTSLGGVGATISQSTNTAAPVLSVVPPPATCSNCATPTAVTIQIPYELQMPTVGGGLMSDAFFVTENGVSGRVYTFLPAPDQIHILTNCDSVLGVSGPSTGRCPWEVTHANGTLVSTASPAAQGEELTAYAVGLGATNPAVPTGQPAAQSVPTAQTFRMSFNFSADAAPSAPPPGAPSIAPLYTGLTQGYVGLYQINFIVPNVPAGLPPCAGQGSGFVNTNLTVSVGGVASFDGAELCVAVP